MAPPRTVVTTSSCNLLLIYRSPKDERLNWPSWLTYSGRFTHISGHPSAVGRAQDSESSPVKDRHSTAEPRNQRASLMCVIAFLFLHTCTVFMWLNISSDSFVMPSYAKAQLSYRWRICPSHAANASKLMNLGSRRFHCWIAEEL